MTTPADHSALIDTLIERLTESYPFPDRAADAAGRLRGALTAGRYAVPLGPELCDRISADLLEACNDRHLRLLWHETIAESADEATLVAQLTELFRIENHGLRRVERLDENLGLIELTLIPPAATAGKAIAAALRLVEHTRALIIDARGARGGAPDGVAFLCSFLFPDGDVHLGDIVHGPAGPSRQYWTSAYLPAPRYLDRPVFVLTSASTFSGGEELAYNLQALGRAIVVGEVTRGGAHPSEVVSLAEHVELRLPVARSVNPVTGGNWEGVGVQPDVLTPAADALDVARRAALERLAA